MFSPTDVAIGDIIVLDTSTYETGTITRYEVISILATGSDNVQAIILYEPDNDNIDPGLDLSYVLGTDGFIARPTPNYSLLPVPSPGIQLLSDKLSFYIHNYNLHNIVDNITGGGGVGSDQVLTEAAPTPTTLGGIPAGTTFSSVPVETVLRDLLYPYQSPTFSQFYIENQNTTIEVGASTVGGLVKFAWTTTNTSNISTNTISIRDVTAGNVVLYDSGANDGNEFINISSVVKITASSHSWRIQALNTKSTTFSKYFTVDWRWRVYYGENVNSTLTEPQIEALRTSQLGSAFAANYAFDGGGYKWIAYPSAFGTATVFKDILTGLDVPFQPVQTITITNTFGIATQYNVHRTTNILGASITISAA